MATRVVLASKRFQKEYPDFLRKYTDLEKNFREFLEFRAARRPDEPFGTKDNRMPGTRFHRCHLIHGKAIVIYQLFGREIRLVAMDEHNAVEGGTNKLMRRYAGSLGQDDYYLFDVDHPVPDKATDEVSMDKHVEPIPELAESIDVVAEPIPEPIPDKVNPLWNDRVVEYLHDRQMLVVPRPAREMIAITLDKELIAPRGDVLLIDPLAPTIYHLTRNEYEAHFQPASRSITSLSEAISATMVEPEPIAQSPQTVNDSHSDSRSRLGIAPQLGRLLVIMEHLQRERRTTRVDMSTLKDHLHERDIRSLSPLMSSAQTKALVRKAGTKGGSRAYYYSLTPIGEQKARSLGDWPFTVAGLRPPFRELGMPALDQIKADYREALRQNDSRTAQNLSSMIRAFTGCSEREIRRVIEGALHRIESERSPSVKLMRLLRGYLSDHHLSDDDITTIAIRQHSIRTVPQILQYLRENYAGRYDPKRAVIIVRELTS